MNIDSIQNGYVIDHIQAGKSMQLYNMLGLDKLDCSVAIIKNAPSRKMGKKDIIKIDARIDISFDLIGFVSPEATVNIIENGKRLEKKHLSLPLMLVDIIKCKNPRCITSTEQELQHIFVRSGKGDSTYRCMYCDTKASL